jgi:pimeloyl-ACP methyl ester carboxylesterase
VGWEDEYVEGRLVVGDGRTIAWTEWGAQGDRVLLRVPGTPGSRWAVRADTSPWAERGLRVITTERPGFGASTPLPGRRFSEHADDLAALLDHLQIEEVFLYGGSGAAPHELALCQRHSDRVVAATVVGGSAPFTDAEVEEMIPLNREAVALLKTGDRQALTAYLAPVREALLADPLAAFADIMASAPAEDAAIIRDPGWRSAFERSMIEALGQGLDGWIDEGIAIEGQWDIDPSRVSTSVTWYHAVEDRNTSIHAARRLVASLPNGRLVEWANAGHLAGYHLERDILDELLSRG